MTAKALIIVIHIADEHKIVLLMALIMATAAPTAVSKIRDQAHTALRRLAGARKAITAYVTKARAAAGPARTTHKIVMYGSSLLLTRAAHIIQVITDHLT